MKKQERTKEEVYAHLAARNGNTVRVADAARTFGCSSASILATMEELERAGRIRRSHGTHKANPRLPDLWERCKAFRAIPSLG